MTTTKSYGIRKVCNLSFEQAVKKTRAALQAEGFGVLTEIDLKEKLKEKLGVDFKKYLILGACNPPLAYKALQAEPEIGLLLPCNVIIYEQDGGSVVAAVDPNSMLEVIGDSPAVGEVARDARTRLSAAIARI
ncbi:MAG TPA: DUF302 domain-containing protein [Thermoanaerobaculia bacterium]|jgi:uncharacterized protein (DUF302 family)|nr:DUF302 domain-containing protein [Thermoanaerobaculia bacterium]